MGQNSKATRENRDQVKSSLLIRLTINLKNNTTKIQRTRGFFHWNGGTCTKCPSVEQKFKNEQFQRLNYTVSFFDSGEKGWVFSFNKMSVPDNSTSTAMHEKKAPPGATHILHLIISTHRSPVHSPSRQKFFVLVDYTPSLAKTSTQ